VMRLRMLDISLKRRSGAEVGSFISP
jgi:hypothetical protein